MTLALGLLAALLVVPPDASPAPPPDGLAREVAAMARIGFSNNASFSPDGRTVAFVSNMSGSPQIWTVPTAGGYPEQITALDDPVGGIAWSPAGTWIAFAVLPGGGLNSQIYLVHPDGRGMTRITEGGKTNNSLGGWSPDGSLLMFSSNQRDSGAMDAWVHEVGKGSRLVSKNTGIGSFTSISADNRRVILDRLVSRGSNDLFLVDLTSGGETLLTAHEGAGDFGGEIAPDGRTVYLSHDLGRDRTAFGRIALSPDGKPGKIETLRAREDAILDGFSMDKNGRQAMLFWNVAGRTEIEVVELSTGKTTARPVLPADLAGGGDFSKDGRLVALTLSGSASPADVWILDLSGGEPRRLTRTPHAGVDLASFVRPEPVRFKAHDGLELSGWFYRPASGKAPYPVVLSFHGGPEGQERPGFRSDYQALLSRGIAVFAPNVRGSYGFGKRFLTLDNGERRFDGVRDIKACVNAAVATGAVDGRRVGIMGGSYGGYMVMAGLTEYPELFAAGANLYGIVNFETFFRDTEGWMAAISKIEYGDPVSQADLLRRLSPLYRLDRVKAPTLVLHGANDTNVPVVEAEQVVSELKKRGVPVEYVLFPDEGHGWRKTPNRIRSTVEIVQWFDKYLAASKAAAPSGGTR
jgi:dipeptidyl aminopeptidase/acylaminoacyl peptidase